MHCALLDLLPAGSVDHCLEVRLRLEEDHDGSVVYGCLLLVRANILEVYLPRRIQYSQQYRLVLLSRHTLTARILEVARIPTTKNGGAEEDSDRLLLAFANWQYSVIAWNHTLADWQTFSLHNFNRPEYQSQQISPIPITGRLLAVDTEGRCALVRVNTDRFATLPLEQMSRSRLLEWGDIEEGLRNVLDWCFLPGYMEPTVAILYEPQPTWPYRLPVQKDTICLLIGTLSAIPSAVSFDSKPRLTIIAQYRGLASDARRLWVPSRSNAARGKSHSGILVFGANTLIHVDPGNPVLSALALNSYNSSKMTGLRKSPTPISLTLESGRWFSWASRMLVCCDDGFIYSLQVVGEAGNRRLGLALSEELSFDQRIHRIIPLINDTLLMVQPKIGDALIYDASEKLKKELDTSLASHSLKDDTMDIDDIYGESSGTNASSTNLGVSGEERGLDLLCTLEILAPLSSFCIGDDKEGNGWNIVATYGDGVDGRMVIFHNTLPLSATKLFNIKGCLNVWNIGSDCYLATTEYSSHVLMRDRKTGRIAESSTSFPVLSERTIFAGCLSGGRVLQQTSSTIRIFASTLDSPEYSDFLLDSEANPIKACLSGSFFVLEHKDQRVTMYSIDDKLELMPLAWHCNQPIIAWDLIQYKDTKQLFIFVTDDGRLSIIDLVDKSTRFSSPVAAQLPLVMAHSDATTTTENALDVDTTNTIVGVKAICSDSDLFLIISTTSTMGITIYRMVGNKFIKLRWGINLPALEIRRIVEGGCLMYRISSSALWLVNQERLFLLQLDAFNEPILCSTALKHARPCQDTPIIITANSKVEELSWSSLSLGSSVPHLKKDFGLECLRTIVYHSPSDTYAALFVSLQDWSLPKDDHAPISDNIDMVVPGDATLPKQYVYTLKLLSSKTWTCIDEFKFAEDEYALCLISATLETKQTTSGRQPFLIVGTSSCRGEDRPARGRLLAFDVISVVPEEGQVEMDRKLKLLVNSEVKGPVTAINHINGYLLAAVGPKVIIYSFENNETLTGVAFVDVGVYGGCVSGVKNFFTVGDVSKSLSFYAFQVKPPKVVVLSRDFFNRPIMAIEHVVSHRGQMVIIAAEPLESSNGVGLVHLLTYDPTSKASQGGQRLIVLGTFSLPTEIIFMKRILLPDGSQACIVAEISGALSMIAPMEEMAFRSLSALQSRISTSLPYLAGHSSRSARQCAQLTYRMYPSPRDLLDSTGRGLLRLLELPLAARKILVERQVGSRLEKTEKLFEFLMQLVCDALSK